MRYFRHPGWRISGVLDLVTPMAAAAAPAPTPARAVWRCRTVGHPVKVAHLGATRRGGGVLPACCPGQPHSASPAAAPGRDPALLSVRPSVCAAMRHGATEGSGPGWEALYAEQSSPQFPAPIQRTIPRSYRQVLICSHGSSRSARLSTVLRSSHLDPDLAPCHASGPRPYKK